MKPQENDTYNNPFNSQKQLQQHIIDKFAKHGHKVKYQFKIKVE